MLQLAEDFSSGEPIQLRRIADEHGIPQRFLVQILLQLKGAGFVASTRGAAGGYQLIKPPHQISLGEVMTVIEGQDEISSNVSSRSATSRVLLDTWQDVAKVQHDALAGITFGDLVKRVKRQTENMYYI